MVVPGYAECFEAPARFSLDGVTEKVNTIVNFIFYHKIFYYAAFSKQFFLIILVLYYFNFTIFYLSVNMLITATVPKLIQNFHYGN